MGRLPLMGRVLGVCPPNRLFGCHYGVLPVEYQHTQEICILSLSHERKRSSYAQKHPRNRRALSTLPYARPSPSARGHLPMSLDPPNLALFNGRWDARCTPPAAMNYLLEKIDTTRRPPTTLRFEDLKKVTILWAAATFIILEMTVYASAATISVPAAACGGLHAEGWPARPLHLQVMNPSAPTWSTHGT